MVYHHFPSGSPWIHGNHWGHGVAASPDCPPAWLRWDEYPLERWSMCMGWPQHSHHSPIGRQFLEATPTSSGFKQKKIDVKQKMFQCLPHSNHSNWHRLPEKTGLLVPDPSAVVVLSFESSALTAPSELNLWGCHNSNAHENSHNGLWSSPIYWVV